MTKTKILIFFTLFLLITLILRADWKKTVEEHMGEINFFGVLIDKLEPGFERIPEEDKGALALILAYSYRSLEKKEKESDGKLKKKEKESDGKLEKRKKVSYWFKRYTRDFLAQDNELSFLSITHNKIQKDILRFRDEYKGRFPVVYKMKLIESPAKPEILEEKRINYFKFPAPREICVLLTISVKCDYELYDTSEYDNSEHRLKKGSLDKGDNYICFPINRDFVKGNDNNETSFELLLGSGQYCNREQVVFSLDYQYPENIKFDPRTGNIILLGQDGKEIEIKDERRTIHQKKIFFDKNKFKKYVFPNLAAGAGLFLLNSLAVDKMYKSPSTSPGVRANLDGSRIAINLFSVGFGLKGLYNLFKEKVLHKNTVSKDITITAEEKQKQYEKEKKMIEEQIDVHIRLKPLAKDALEGER